jgi:tight adherence protein C
MDALSIKIIISLFVFTVVFLVGFSIVLFRSRNKSLDVRMTGVFEDDPLFEKPEENSGVMKFLQKLGNFASHGRASASLWEQMIQAGYLHPYAPAIYTGAKILFFIVGFLLTMILVLTFSSEEMVFSSQMTAVLGGATVAFFIPNLLIVYKLKKRRGEICRHLPDAVDLLQICVSSGLGLDMAWNIVADEVRQVSPVLSSSMSLTNFEMHLGVTRIEAMKHMAERTGVEELRSLAAILIQTDRFGTSIAETLQIFAESVREERSFVAQEAAEKVSVKMLIPMVLFIFPAAIIVMVGPAAISLMQTL